MSLLKTAELFAGKTHKVLETERNRYNYDKGFADYYRKKMSKKVVNNQFVKTPQKGSTLLMSEYCLDLMDECRKRVCNQYILGKRSRALTMFLGERDGIIQVAVPLLDSGNGCISMPEIKQEGFAGAITELIRNEYKPVALARLTVYNSFEHNEPTGFQKQLQKVYKSIFFISLGSGIIRIERLNDNKAVDYNLKIV